MQEADAPARIEGINPQLKEELQQIIAADDIHSMHQEIFFGREKESSEDKGDGVIIETGEGNSKHIMWIYGNEEKGIQEQIMLLGPDSSQTGYTEENVRHYQEVLKMNKDGNILMPLILDPIVMDKYTYKNIVGYYDAKEIVMAGTNLSDPEQVDKINRHMQDAIKHSKSKSIQQKIGADTHDRVYAEPGSVSEPITRGGLTPRRGFSPGKFIQGALKHFPGRKGP